MDFRLGRFPRIYNGFTQMQIKAIAVDFISSIVIVIKRFILLIFTPYKTMRKISLEQDYSQIFILFLLVFIYFKFAYFLRSDAYPATFIFLVFIFNFCMTVFFFYIINRLTHKPVRLSSFAFTLSYSLVPTLVWFISNSILYLLVPPPRTFSILGKAFSGFFIAYSLSLLAWKIILFYLSIRFSAKVNFYRAVYLIILYLCIFIPYSFLLYHFKIFRIPFI